VEKVAEELPAETVSVAGIVTLPPELLAIATAVAAETACVSVVVQVVVGAAGAAIALGVQLTFDTSTATLKPTFCAAP